MEVQILGPLRVLDESGGECNIGAASQRRLLIRLAIAAPNAVSADRLAEDLQLSAGGLRTAVSRLRKSVGKHLTTQIPGYALAGTTADATVFEALLEEGSASGPEERVAILDKALELWRGVALSEVSAEEWAQPEAARLEELRTLARETHVQAKLDLGRHPEVISEVEALISDQPYRDEPRRLVIEALHRSGRRTEALRAFQDYRQLLNDEIGTDPGQALWDLDAEISKEADVRIVPSAPKRPGQLPSPATAMVGRKQDVEAVAEALGDSRVVTLSGVGGVGKTRLALEIARRTGPDSYSDICFVDLSTGEGPDGVTSAVAAALGLPRDLNASAIAESIVGEELLLVVDNCEHVVVDSAELIEELTARCPRLRVLATSREGLALPGERIYAVAPLAADSEAVDLFEARARAADNSFELTPEVRDVVARICLTLDGIPLAIELAAARVRSMSVADIESRLDDRFKLLSGVRRTGIDRHRTLAAAVGWSYDLLDQDEQVALLWLGAFVGEFSFMDAVDLLTRAPVEEPDPCVVSLTEKSMLVRTSEGRGYRILDTIRHFSLEQQSSAGALEDSRAAHAEWVSEVNAAASREIREEGSVAAALRMDETYEDLAAAVHWALEHDRVALAVELVSMFDCSVQFVPIAGPLAREVLTRPEASSCPGSLVAEIVDIFDQYASGTPGLTDRVRGLVDRLLGGQKSYVALFTGTHVLAGSAGVEEGVAAADRLLGMARHEGDELAELHVLMARTYVEPEEEHTVALEGFVGRPGYAAYQADISMCLSSAYLETDAGRAVEVLELGAIAAESLRAQHVETLLLARLAYLGLRWGDAVERTRFIAQRLRGPGGLPHRQRAFLVQRWFVIAASLLAVEEHAAATTAHAVVESMPLTRSVVTKGMIQAGSDLLREQLELDSPQDRPAPSPAELPDLAAKYIDLILSHFPQDSHTAK